jgi:hypothetical protein
MISDVSLADSMFDLVLSHERISSRDMLPPSELGDGDGLARSQSSDRTSLVVALGAGL